MSDDAVLLMRFAGPMQAWGGSSRFTRRQTNAEPTKSGVVGLLAAAQGRRRSDPVEDLAGLRVGVRVDRAGVVQVDFQMASRLESGRGGQVSRATMPLSYRSYIADAVFLVGVQGSHQLIEGLAEAVNHPFYAPTLGRRSCPPAGRLFLGIEEGSVESVLRSHVWLGAPTSSVARRRSHAPGRLMLVRDLAPGESLVGAEREHDVPVSFDPRHREFAWRWVRRELVPNPSFPRQGSVEHDAFAEVV